MPDREKGEKVKARTKSFFVMLAIVSMTVSFGNIILIPTKAVAAAGDTVLISKNSSDDPANDDSTEPTISEDGNLVAFRSDATDIISGTSGSQIYLYNRSSDSFEIVSKSSSGTTGNGTSEDSTMSDDGRYVAFRSNASNLVSGQTCDVFVRDRQSNTTSLVSVQNSGVSGFGCGFYPKISAEGDTVVFVGNNLDSYSGTSWQVGLFAKDLGDTSVERVSVDSNEDPIVYGGDPYVSGDGNLVLFNSCSILPNSGTKCVANTYMRDRAAGTTELVSIPPNTLGPEEVFEGHGQAISDDGRYVIMTGNVCNAVLCVNGYDNKIYIRDLQTDETEEVLSYNDPNVAPSNGFFSFSGTGRYFSFSSIANELDENDTNGANDIFVYDREIEKTKRVTVSSNNDQSDDDTFYSEISADGEHVAFSSAATTLISGDPNNEDVFVHDVSDFIDCDPWNAPDSEDDPDGDGWSNSEELNRMHTDPQIPDLWVEADYFDGYEPDTSVFEVAERAFTAAGIKFHYSVGQAIDPDSYVGGRSGSDTVEVISGTLSEKIDESEDLLQSYRSFCRYVHVIFAGKEDESVAYTLGGANAGSNIDRSGALIYSIRVEERINAGGVLATENEILSHILLHELGHTLQAFHETSNGNYDARVDGIDGVDDFNEYNAMAYGGLTNSPSSGHASYDHLMNGEGNHNPLLGATELDSEPRYAIETIEQFQLNNKLGVETNSYVATDEV